MTRILSGTAAVLNGARTVVFTGPALSDANCPADGNVVLGGAAYFIATRTDTASFELTRDYEGADGTVTCEIDPLNAAAINLARVARSITDYDAKLALLDANGKGLFYNLIGVTGAGDPGPGNMAFDNADMAQVSELYLDVLDANAGGLDVAALIDLWSPGTVLIVRSLASSAYAAFQITQAPVDAGGFRRVAVEPVGSDGVLAAELVAVEWRLAGADKDVDAEVNDLAGLAAFDDELAGFRVLVRNVGDGRAARYSKLSDAAADWSDPAYVTGPVGPLPDIEVGSTTTLAPGSDATVTPTPITGGVSLAFGVPAGRGQVTKGDYNPATAYVLDDAVLDNGSTWIALGPTTGNAPPVLPTTSNAWWQLLARKGTDGTGTGDVVGPSGAVADRIATFDGATGKLLKDGGKTIAELVPADGSVTNSILAPMAAATIKGRVAAGTGDPADLTAAQVLSLLSAVRPCFRADKNGVDQIGVGNAPITFTHEAFDVGGYYDAANSRWTPPVGKVRLYVRILIAGAVADQTAYVVSFTKNGVIAASSVIRASGSNSMSMDLSEIVETNGTDYWGVNLSSAAASVTASGPVEYTTFSGESL